ncbi:gamma-glutamyl-gamma-aminobutyrate hydrolase family protein [Streptococcus merionis]|uniref:gamma-glutamyl-gamma-aminobutyrate hydrolase family protein n=1 Tax=Streptococcus merionis TaxID=400065 RepID=UPI0026F027FB|nr:gamma-glutamyl-gamma-aminobutyrate hydrolase family protein [Streptococcus merionis]
MSHPIIGISSNIEYNPEDRNFFQVYCAKGYVDGVQKAGGLPLVLPIGAPELAVQYAEMIDKLILTGGQNVLPEYYGEEKTISSDDYSRDRDEFELALIREMVKRNKPIFSICRGTQLFNVAMGGTLYQEIQSHWQDLSAMHPTHKVNLIPGTPLSDIFGEHPSINSFHRQAIKELASNLEVIGSSAEDNIIEAVKTNDGYPYLGVQWHPEFMIDHREEDLKLFDYIVNQL